MKGNLVCDFHSLLNALLPVAEELGEKKASVIVSSGAEISVELRTAFKDGAVVRTVIVTAPN
jgi:hypothetical protein